MDHPLVIANVDPPALGVPDRLGALPGGVGQKRRGGDPTVPHHLESLGGRGDLDRRARGRRGHLAREHRRAAGGERQAQRREEAGTHALPLLLLPGRARGGALWPPRYRTAGGRPSRSCSAAVWAGEVAKSSRTFWAALRAASGLPRATTDAGLAHQGEGLEEGVPLGDQALVGGRGHYRSRPWPRRPARSPRGRRSGTARPSRPRRGSPGRPSPRRRSASGRSRGCRAAGRPRRRRRSRRGPCGPPRGPCGRRRPGRPWSGTPSPPAAGSW